MKEISDKVISFIVKRPWFVILFVILFVVSALGFLPKITIDNSVDVFFDKNSKSYIDFQEWKEQFGSDQIVIVAFEDKDIFTAENLTLISELTEKFESIKNVSEVTSLTNVNNIIGFENDFIVEPLVEDVPSDLEELKEIKEQALSNPLYVKNLISKDASTTAFIIELEHKPHTASDIYKKEVIENIQKILNNDVPRDKKFYISGFTAIEYFYALYMQEDLKKFMPFIFLIIICILYFSFRCLAGVLLPLITIFITLILTLLLLYVCGFSINNITSIVPPIILAIAVADSIHFVGANILKQKISGMDKDSLLVESMKQLFFPCLLTTITTSVGFLSLTVSRIPPVKELGVVVGGGVIIAFLVTFIFLPAAIKQFKLFQKQSNDELDIKVTGKGIFDKRIDGFLEGVGRFNQKFRYIVLSVFLLIVVFSFWGLSKVKTETSVLEYFKKSSPIYQATTFVENNLSGVHFLNVSIKAKSLDYFKEPNSLKNIEKLQSFLKLIPEVDKTTSVVDYIKEINKSFHNEEGEYYRIPESKELIAQYLLLYGDTDLNDFVDSEWKWTTVSVRLKEHSTTKLRKVIEDINMYLDENFNGNVTAETLGQTQLEVETNEAVTSGQVQSIVLAMAIIFGMMFLIFKSLSVGLVSIVPNVLPILVNFGIMGWMGIRLDSATSMISAIGIGIIVDDTIHFLHNFGENLKGKGDYISAMNKTLKAKGRPILLTSIVLFFGFGVLYFSKFVPTSSFGLLSALLMVNALWADLFILPCLLIVLKPKFKR